MSDHKDWATPENLYRAADNADAAGFTEYGWKLQGSAERIESLWAEIESLQRENEELKADNEQLRDMVLSPDEIKELRTAAITPEMREKAEAALSEYVHWQRYKKCVEVVRDLLGEQG